MHKSQVVVLQLSPKFAHVHDTLQIAWLGGPPAPSLPLSIKSSLLRVYGLGRRRTSGKDDLQTKSQDTATIVLSCTSPRQGRKDQAFALRMTTTTTTRLRLLPMRLQRVMRTNISFNVHPNVHTCTKPCKWYGLVGLQRPARDLPCRSDALFFSFVGWADPA